MKQNDDSEDYTGLERLVKKAKAGDQQAKEKLIFAFQPLILTTIQKYVYDQKEYEDAYQDAVCVFLEALRDFELDARIYFQVFIRSRLTNYFKKRREGRFERSIKPEESLDRQIEGEGGAIALIELIIDCLLYTSREVLRDHEAEIEQSQVLQELNLKPKGYFLLSAHREENIDNEDNFMALMEAINHSAEK